MRQAWKQGSGPNGLGLVLLQRKPEGWKAVECASRSLTEVEKRYPQIDREALAIRWACERRYLYLTGSSFVIETDHQPLLPLFNNSHSRPPIRIEPWLLYVQQFDFELKYCPGSKNAADYLSRHVIPLTESDTKVNPDAEAMQKDQEAKARMSAYADLKRRTKPHSLKVGDHTLVKQRIQNKASPRFEPVPYTILDVKGSMITAKRTTDQKLVTRNSSSFFKKLPNPLMEVIQESSPVPQVELQAPLDFDGPESIERT